MKISRLSVRMMSEAFDASFTPKLECQFESCDYSIPYGTKNVAYKFMAEHIKLCHNHDEIKRRVREIKHQAKMIRNADKAIVFEPVNASQSPTPTRERIPQ